MTPPLMSAASWTHNCGAPRTSEPKATDPFGLPSKESPLRRFSPLRLDHARFDWPAPSGSANYSYARLTAKAI